MASESGTEKRETLADIVAEYRRDYEDMKVRRLYLPTAEYLRRLLDRIVAAARREREELIDDMNDDTLLVKTCMTCKHYNRKQQYCHTKDCSTDRELASRIVPIFDNGPCDKWECK